MAGKTFPGIGELEDESPPVDPGDAADGDDTDGSDSRPFYSGPTVVDDVKVEEGLKKLRSLDAPPGPLTGITKAVVDALESGHSGSVDVPIEMSPIALPSLDTPYKPPPMTHPMRETAVGRNVVGPMAAQPETPPPFDDRALRGTMFGHSIHAPEFALPAPEEPPPPGALALLNRGAPTKTLAIFPPPRAPAGPPTEPQPFPRAGQYRSTPLTPISVVDPPKKKLYTRIAIGGAAILAIIGIAVFWARPSDDSDSPAAAAAAAAANAAANKIQTTAATQTTPPSSLVPPVTAPPTTAPPAPANPTLPMPSGSAVAAKPVLAKPPLERPLLEKPPVEKPLAAKPPAEKPPTPQPEAQASKPTPSRASPSVGKPAARRPAEAQSAGETETPARAHHTHSAAPRHHDGDKGSDTDAPTVKTTRRHTPEDDPDATMAPSIE
jgi:hypothetical protein